MSFLGAGTDPLRKTFGTLSVAQRNQLSDPFATPATPGLADVFGRMPVAQQQSFRSAFGGPDVGDLPFGQQINAGDIAGLGQGPDAQPRVGNRISAADVLRSSRTGSGAGQGLSAGGQGLSGMGQMASLGGDWAGVDQWNSEIQAASSQTGVPANLIKAVMKLESGGNWTTSPVGAVGLMQIMPQYWGHLGDIYSPAGNIMVGAQILSQLNGQYGSWDRAVRAYFSGSPDPGNAAQDYYGTTSDVYWNRVSTDWQALNAAGGGGFGGGLPSMMGNPAFINGLTGGNSVGNSIVQQALQYVGVPYVWGGIPGRGDNPWDSGWDCSGMTYWLDQNYGSGQLPMGSHYQFDYAQRTGQLFTNSAQLQPGDLIFINTGWQGGAGANLNAAGHVGIYIGNGQMLHASNPSSGTIVSPLSGYGGILGFMHQGFSGGAAGVPGMMGMGQPAMGGGGGGPMQRLLALLRG